MTTKNNFLDYHSIIQLYIPYNWLVGGESKNNWTSFGVN